MVSSTRVVLGSAAVVVGLGVVICLLTLGWADSYSLGYPTEFPSLAIEGTPIPLLLPLLAMVPYVLAVMPLLRNRFLVYSRTRREIRHSVRGLYVGAAVVTFAVFALIILIYAVGGEVGDVDYDPAAVGYTEAGLSTFSQLTVYGSWAYYGFLSIWFGINAAAYAVLGLSGLLLVRHPLVGLLVPWIVFCVVAFGMAVLGLETYSPLTLAPFNLIQLPIWMPFLPAGTVWAIALGSVVAVIRRAPQLHVAG